MDSVNIGDLELLRPLNLPVKRQAHSVSLDFVDESAGYLCSLLCGVGFTTAPGVLLAFISVSLATLLRVALLRALEPPGLVHIA